MKIVVCTNCQEELAEVKCLTSFSAQVLCGKCGTSVGWKFDPEPVPEPSDPGAPAGGEAATATS